MVFKILSRVINKCKRIYRKQLFKSEIGCNHNDFNIVGDITVINKNSDYLKKARKYGHFTGYEN